MFRVSASVQVAETQQGLVVKGVPIASMRDIKFTRCPRLRRMPFQRKSAELLVKWEKKLLKKGGGTYLLLLGIL